MKQLRHKERNLIEKKIEGRDIGRVRDPEMDYFSMVDEILVEGVDDEELMKEFALEEELEGKSGEEILKVKIEGYDYGSDVVGEDLEQDFGEELGDELFEEFERDLDDKLSFDY